MVTRKLGLGLFLSVLVLGVLAIAQLKRPSDAPPVQTDVVSSPLFNIPGLNQDQINLADYKGKVVLVNFWATWCPPCVAEVPHFVKIHNDYADQGVAVIALSVDQNTDPVGPFIKTHQMNYPVGMATPEIVAQYGGVSSIPTTFILDQDLNIVQKIVGYRDTEFFESQILKLL